MKYLSILMGCIFGIFIVPQIGIATEPVVVGVLHSERFPYSTMMKNSFEMALEMINQEGGIKGSPLKLVYGNDQGKPKTGEKIDK